MGYESSACATRRLRRYSDATRDLTLRAELLGLLETPPNRTTTPAAIDVSTATLVSGTSAMHTPSLAAAAPFATWTGELLAGELSRTTPAVIIDADFAPRLPVEHLERAMAYGDVVRDLIASLAEHARAIALVREAHALGAVTLPSEVAAALMTAADSLPVALRGGALSIV